MAFAAGAVSRVGINLTANTAAAEAGIASVKGRLAWRRAAGGGQSVDNRPACDGRNQRQDFQLIRGPCVQHVAVG